MLKLHGMRPVREKLAIGGGVCITVAVAIVCPAVLGAAAATVTQSIATFVIIGAANVRRYEME